MIYNVGEVWLSDEVGSYVKTVRDKNGSCEHCVFSEDSGCGVSCPAKSYNWHPCYHSDREDGEDVHFEMATQEEIEAAYPFVKVGDKVLWADKRTPIGQENVWVVRDVYSNGLIKIAMGMSEVEVPVMEVIKVEE